MFAEFQLLTNCESANDAVEEAKGKCAAGQVPKKRARRGCGIDEYNKDYGDDDVGVVDNIISTGECQIVLKDINGI